MEKRREIRNSTAEFLIFQAEAKEQGVEVYYKDENIWATQKAMAKQRSCHAISSMGNKCFKGLRHSWLCAGQKAYGERNVLG